MSAEGAAPGAAPGPAEGAADGAAPGAGEGAAPEPSAAAARATAAAAADAPLPRRMVWLALAAATLLAALLRLPWLDHQSLWLDEIFTRDVVGEPTLSGLWRQLRATESTPPLYYLIAWSSGAYGAVALRAISALALVAAVPVAYLAFRGWIGQRAALATAAILAASPMLVSYAANARSYGLFVLTALLSVWATAALLEHGERRRFALWAAASVACVWTHYFGVFVVGAEIVALLVVRPLLRRATAAWTGMLGACLIGLVPLAADQSGDERAGFITSTGLATRVSDTARQFAMGSNVPAAWLEAAGLALMCLAVAAGAVMALRSGRGRVPLALAAIAVGTPLLLAALGIEDRFHPRNVIAAVPLAAAVAAPAMLRLRAVPLALYLVLAIATSLWVASDWRYEQADWRGALERTATIDRGAAVVAVTVTDAPVVRTYLGREPAGPAGVLARRAWIVVQPVRATGDRALGPAPAPTIAGFTTQRALALHGFRLVLVGAPEPLRISAGDVGGASVFPGDPAR